MLQQQQQSGGGRLGQLVWRSRVQGSRVVVCSVAAGGRGAARQGSGDGGGLLGEGGGGGWRCRRRLAWTADGRGGLVVEKTLQEKEMQLDDECFARFFESHIAGGRVSYLEKYVSCGADTVVMLRALEGQYDLFIVGRGGSRNPVLTAGLSDWAECPELGPVGDILSSADFSETASVLIIQQHDVGRDEKLTEVLPMLFLIQLNKR